MLGRVPSEMHLSRLARVHRADWRVQSDIMIGVFDSGSGGLTVLRAFRDRLPEQSFAYLGDHENGPYGARSAAQVYALTLSGVERLFHQGCELVILACNTAAAVALRRLQQEWLPAKFPGRRVLGVFVPTVEAITGVPWHQKLPSRAGVDSEITAGIFATPRTVASGAFENEIKMRNPGARIIQQACPNLAESIEADAPRRTITALIESAAAELLASAGSVQPDCFILGCTHYPLVLDLFLDILPAGAEVLEQPSIAAHSLAGYLERHPEFSSAADAPEDGGASVSFFTTGEPAKASVHARRFFGQEVSFSKI